jgi:quercetin dioxygenase-like cupin family protein
VINLTSLQSAKTEEGPDGVFRTTLSFGEQAMLCHFKANQGARIPLHNHPAVQSGFLIAGKVKFQRGEGGDGFVAEPGSSYFFEPNEFHGAEVLEDSEFVEVFSPMRPEYAPK